MDLKIEGPQLRVRGGCLSAISVTSMTFTGYLGSQIPEEHLREHLREEQWVAVFLLRLIYLSDDTALNILLKGVNGV